MSDKIKNWTWQDMKDFCNSLPESEMNKPVQLIREEEVIGKIYGEQLGENMLYDPEEREEGCIEESEIPETDWPNYEIAYNKGTALLFENF